MITRENPRGKLFVLTVFHDGKDTEKTMVATNGKSIVVNCPLEEVSQRWFNWVMKGQFIQVAFDNLDADEREFLITGLTKDEWNKLFPTETEIMNTWYCHKCQWQDTNNKQTQNCPTCGISSVLLIR